MGEKIGSNVNILILMVFLGILVVLITRSGASAAYGEWAAKKIKNKKGSMFATMFLGVLIFVDDYFNCLTVGTVMRPVTEPIQSFRAKLAYLMDATAGSGLYYLRFPAGRRQWDPPCRRTAVWMV